MRGGEGKAQKMCQRQDAGSGRRRGSAALRRCSQRGVQCERGLLLHPGHVPMYRPAPNSRLPQNFVLTSIPLKIFKTRLKVVFPACPPSPQLPDQLCQDPARPGHHGGQHLCQGVFLFLCSSPAAAKHYSTLHKALTSIESARLTGLGLGLG